MGNDYVGVIGVYPILLSSFNFYVGSTFVLAKVGSTFCLFIKH